MDAVAALPACAAQRGIHLGHRRVLLCRHHARRRHADHRHGGDERLSPGAAAKDPRPQRPSLDPAAGVAADRLAGAGRADFQGPRRPACRADRGGAGAGVVAVQRLRRLGARHPCRRSRQAVLDRQEHQAGHARRLRRRAGHRRRQPARRAALGARRRQSHAGGAARRGDPDGYDAAHQSLQDRRGVRDRHVGIRRRLRVHAARRGAGLFQSRWRRYRDRGLYRRPRPGRSLPQACDRRRGAADLYDRLAPAQRHVLQCAAGRAQRDVFDPDIDRAGGGAQYRFRPDHAGEGQGQRHRHPAHHGRDARRHHAHLSHHRRLDRRGRHGGRLPARHGDLSQYRSRSGISCRGSPIPSCSPPSFISCRGCLPT